MDGLNIKDFYGEILNEHNINPNHKIEMSSPDIHALCLILVVEMILPLT